MLFNEQVKHERRESRARHALITRHSVLVDVQRKVQGALTTGAQTHSEVALAVEKLSREMGAYAQSGGVDLQRLETLTQPHRSVVERAPLAAG